MPVDPKRRDLFLIGSGVHDVTGPAAEVGMMGYARGSQKTAGIHTRLRSRAFVIASRSNEKRVVFVSADLHSISQAVKCGVVEKLKERFGAGLYDHDNVLLSATHTHSGPGGFSRYRLYQFPYFKFNEQNYGVIVDGICRSIVKAHEGLKPGTIRIASDELLHASINRSPRPYRKNRDADRRPGHDTDKLMTVLKLEHTGGRAVGMICWFAVHATSMSRTNQLISGDNKGYASYLFEKRMGTRYDAKKTFVAAFAQSNEGDSSPNVCNSDIPGARTVDERDPRDVPPDVCREGYCGEGADEFESTRLSGQRQFEKAWQLYEVATERLVGVVDYRHQHVTMDSVVLPEAKRHERRTCLAAIGFALFAGTPDGRGPFSAAREGMTCQEAAQYFFPFPFPCQWREPWECQGVKPSAYVKGIPGIPLTPHVLPAQIVSIGDLALVAVPFELTTMAGRRLRETVSNVLELEGRRIVIAGLANAYASYVTTPEEYDLQFYEGASTLFGKWTLDALRQEFETLATALKTGDPVDPGPEPPALLTADMDSPSPEMSFQFGLNEDMSISVDFGPFYRTPETNSQDEVAKDDTPSSVFYGDVFIDAFPAYQRGDTVCVTFWGGNPNNEPRIQGTFLKVERKAGSEWKTEANDWDWETKYLWKRPYPHSPWYRSYSHVTVEWCIPESARPGIYRIRHFGHWKGGGEMHPYRGTSRKFGVA